MQYKSVENPFYGNIQLFIKLYKIIKKKSSNPVQYPFDLWNISRLSAISFQYELERKKKFIENLEN